MILVKDEKGSRIPRRPLGCPALKTKLLMGRRNYIKW